MIRVLLAIVFILNILLLNGCEWFRPPPPQEPGIGKAVSWQTLPGWQQDRLTEAWPILLAQCPRMIRKDQRWEPLCEAAKQVVASNEDAVREFLMSHFQPREILGKGGDPVGLMTGYFQPILRGSMQPSEIYRYPLYRRPDSLLRIELGELFPELKGKRVRGRLDGQRVIPYYDRAEIDREPSPLQGSELIWIDDPFDTFFVQIQGSGKVQLDDGRMVAVSYADQNGHPYISIGRKLVEMGEMTIDQVSAASIRNWLKQHPDRAQALLNENPSYVFFVLRENADENPRGSLNVPLTDLRSIAVDRRIIPLGSLVWLDTTLPDQQPLQRLVFAQDTGGAINGPVRADVYFGTGDEAGKLAGSMKQDGRLFILEPLFEQAAQAQKS